MESIYLHLLLFSIVSYLITYLAGHFLSAFLKLPPRFPMIKEFIKPCIGFYTIIGVYSIYKTNGVTINTGLVIIFAFLFLWLRSNKYIRPAKDAFIQLRSFLFLPYLGIQITVLVIFFFYLLMKIWSPVSGQTYLTHGDFYNYDTLIEHLNKTGIEGYFADWYSGTIPAHTLYHFGELWYAAFYTFLTGQGAFYTFYFLLFTHCIVIYFLGACALIELFIQPRNKTFYILGVFVLFICGISFYIPQHSIFTRGDWWDVGLLFQPKYFFTAIFVFWCLLLVKLKKTEVIMLIGLATVFACTLAVPAVLLAVGSFTLFWWLFCRISFREALRLLIPVTVIVLFIALYMLFMQYINDRNTIIDSSLKIHVLTFSSIQYLKTAINCIIGQVIKSIFSVYLYIVLFYLCVRNQGYPGRELLKILPLIVIIHISSICAYAIFCNSADAVQLFTIVYVPLSAITGFLIFIVLMKSTPPLKIAAILLLFASVFQTREWTREERINEQFTRQVRSVYDGSVSVFFKSGEDYSSIFSKNINVYIPSAYLKMYYREYNPVCLSVFEIPKSKEINLKSAEENMIRNSTFYKFVLLQKMQHQFFSPEQSQSDFIHKYKVRFAFAYRHAQLPAFLQQQVVYSFKDTLEGITLYKLKAN